MSDKDLTIKKVMTKKVITIKSGTTLGEAAEIMVKNNISGAPVVDKDGKMIGIISEKDLFKKFYPNLQEIIKHVGLWLDNERVEEGIRKKKEIAVDKIMATEIISAEPDDPVLKVGSMMLVNRIHRVPVLDRGKLVGIVARPDIFRRLMKSDLHLK